MLMKNAVFMSFNPNLMPPTNMYNSASLKYGVVKSYYNKAHSATLNLQQET